LTNCPYLGPGDGSSKDKFLAFKSWRFARLFAAKVRYSLPAPIPRFVLNQSDADEDPI
jgi:hypothetical protein